MIRVDFNYSDINTVDYSELVRLRHLLGGGWLKDYGERENSRRVYTFRTKEEVDIFVSALESRGLDYKIGKGMKRS